ncbi:4'-phosphopantetheinyl transferase family protein [Streptomyces chrestomyceticus]|uniref:4'-phosphopantetheinyl transferase family protein n=1 Tax=Streptomyces chrestomyceticus TaxID=68185 RepID=UPI0019D0AC09|nr:4'-phosphopantetheinyl transferase superfamily protein [Streptomyces chrestomyceticus]
MTGTGGQPTAVVAGTDEVLRAVPAYERLLTGVERRRAVAFLTPAPRADFIAAHVLVRLCAARLLDRPADSLVLEQRCPGCGSGEHGRPGLAGLPQVYVSLSHTTGVVAAVAGHEPVGVDVERRTLPDSVRGAAGRVLSAAERAAMREHADPDAYFLRQWVRKECFVKLGRTTLGGLAAVDLSGLPDGSAGPYRHGDLYVLDHTDARRDAVAAVVSTARPRFGAAVPYVNPEHPADLEPRRT